MADNIRFKQGSLAALAGQSVANGTLWFTTDEGAIYLDVNNERVRFGDYITVANIAALPASGHAYESALYYAIAENVLARWEKPSEAHPNGRWVQLNAAGLSKIVVNGTGNVLAGATVTLDPETGAKVLTFKTESVATSEGLQNLQTTVSGFESEINTLKGDANTAGSVAKAVADAKADLQAKIDAIDALADQSIADAAKAQKAADDAQTYAEGVQNNLNTTNINLDAANGEISGLKTQVGTGTVDSRIEAAKTEMQGKIDAVDVIADQGVADAAAALAAAQAAQGTANTNTNTIQGLDTRLQGAEADIDGLQSAVNTLNGDDQTVGSVDYKVAQEVAKILNDNDDSDIDTLEEIAAWITNDTTGVASMVKDISDIKVKDQAQDTALEGLRADIDANKTTAENAVSGLETKLVGNAENLKTMGALEDAVVAAKAQADKGVDDAAAAKQYAEGVQSNLNNTNTTIEGHTSDINDLKGRMTTAEGEIDDLQAADTAIRGEFAAADTALETKLVGGATEYTDLGKAQTAIQANTTSIQNIETNIEAINNVLQWDTFQ